MLRSRDLTYLRNSLMAIAGDLPTLSETNMFTSWLASTSEFVCKYKQVVKAASITQAQDTVLTASSVHQGSFCLAQFLKMAACRCLAVCKYRLSVLGTNNLPAVTV